MGAYDQTTHWTADRYHCGSLRGTGAPNGSVSQNICSSGKFLLAGRCERNSMSFEGKCGWEKDNRGCLRGFQSETSPPPPPSPTHWGSLFLNFALRPMDTRCPSQWHGVIRTSWDEDPLRSRSSSLRFSLSCPIWGSFSSEAENSELQISSYELWTRWFDRCNFCT